MKEKELLDKITLRKIIDQISPFRKKLIFQMYYIDGFSFKKISRIMRVEEDEIKDMIESTVLTLREKYAKTNYFDFQAGSRKKSRTAE